MSSEAPNPADGSESSLGTAQSTSVASKFRRKTKLRRNSMLSVNSEAGTSSAKEVSVESSSLPPKAERIAASAGSKDSSPESSPGRRLVEEQLLQDVKDAPSETTDVPVDDGQVESVTSQDHQSPPQSPPSDNVNSESQHLASFLQSKEDLDEVKSIVLDLLGWGVHPEYLVTLGLSPAVVFRVFSDLNLRLPTNLDTSSEVVTQAYPGGQPPAAFAVPLNAA